MNKSRTIWTKLTEDELAHIAKTGACPDCLDGRLVESLSSGSSTNYQCATRDCGSCFNKAVEMERISEPQPFLRPWSLYQR